MTREEAALILTELADAYSAYDSPLGRWIETKYIPAHRMGADALRGFDRVLTFDEFMRMDGQPVVLQFGNGEEEWLFNKEEVRDDLDPDFYGMEYNDPIGHFGLHVMGWRALIRVPKLPEVEG